MLTSKKIYLQMYFAAGVYLSEAPFPSVAPYSPAYTLYIRTLYSILIHIRKGGRGKEMNQREG